MSSATAGHVFCTNHHRGQLSSKVSCWPTMFDFKNFLSAVELVENTTYLAIRAKQILKIQIDPSLEPIWFPAAPTKSEHPLPISIHGMASAGVLHKADGHEHKAGTTQRSSGETAWH